MRVVFLTSDDAANLDFSQNPIRHKSENVADGKLPKANESAACGGVADENPGTGGGEGMNLPEGDGWSVEL